MLVDYIGIKFNKDKFSALDGKTKVTFTTNSMETGKEFVVEASSAGICFRGESPVISDREQLNEFARLVGDAYTEHRKLVPKIVTSPSGH